MKYQAAILGAWLTAGLAAGLAGCAAPPTTPAAGDAPLPALGPDDLARVRTAIRAAQPGDTVTLPAGVWTNVQLVADANGLENRPITLRAAEPGRTVFEGQSEVTLAGSFLVVDGIVFRGATDTKAPPIRFARASAGCRLTNCAILDFKAVFSDRFQYVTVGGTQQRVDHCLFTGKANMGPVLAADGGTHVQIDHNYFRDIPFNSANGREIIQVVGIGSNDEPLSAGGGYWLIEQNLFDRADGEGAEIISLKSNFNLVRANTVRASRGALNMRSGGANTFEGNYIFGQGAEGTSGLRISGRQARAEYNYITGVRVTALRLHAGEYIQKDISGGYQPLLREGSPLGHVAHYLQLIDADVANNIVVDAPGVVLEYGTGYGGAWPAEQLILLPDNLTLEKNLFVSLGGAMEWRLHLGDEKAALLPAEARPRALRGGNNFFFGAPAPDAPPAFGVRTDDPGLVKGADGLYLPAATGAAVAAGFDAAGFRRYRPIGPAEVGPAWMQR